MQSKSEQIAGLIQARLRAGHYALNGMPGERRLAQEMGVSHMTARKAVQRLIAQGVLPRRPSGQAAVSDVRIRPKRSTLHVAYVVPAFDSPTYNIFRVAVEKAVRAKGGSVTVASYVEPTDPSLTEALDGDFDGIFLMITAQQMPSILHERLRRDCHRIVSLCSSMTELGIPCVDNGTPESIIILMKHLADLGHTRIDCVNTQAHDTVVRQRIEKWRIALDSLKLQGTLHDDPVRPYAYPDLQAVEVARRVLSSNDRPSAIFAATQSAAVGVNRAAWELGLKVGTNLSLCTCDGPQEAQLMTPSITTLALPDPVPFVTRGLEWFMTKGRDWRGSLNIAPDRVPLLIGESTGPCHPTSPNRSQIRKEKISGNDQPCKV